MSLLLLSTVSSQTTNGTFMLHLHSPEATETVRTGRTSTFPQYWVKHEPSSTDISKYFYKGNNNKNRLLYRTEPIFSINKNVQVFRIGLTFVFCFCLFLCFFFCFFFFCYCCCCCCCCFCLFFFVLFYCFLLFFLFFFCFFWFLFLLFCKLRQTNFRHWCFEKEELFFVSWLYFWYE